jgi:putative transposase
LDVKKRFSEEQIIGFLREADKGIALKELCRKHGFSEASYYLWRSKHGGLGRKRFQTGYVRLNR